MSNNPFSLPQLCRLCPVRNPALFLPPSLTAPGCGCGIHFTAFCPHFAENRPKVQHKSPRLPPCSGVEVGTRGDSGLQDPLNRPAGNDGVCPSRPVPLHFVSRHSAPRLVHWSRFLKRRIFFDCFCMQLGVFGHMRTL